MIALVQAVVLAASGDVSRYLFGMVIGGLVGAAIGNWKGRLVLGIVLGALLGCIGWIIVAVIPKKDPGY